MDDSLLAGRYRRGRELGRGAMGTVWLATDELLHRTVAIKTLHAGADAGLVERIVREARLAASLNHPHAVVVHDLVVVDERPHVIMEYVPGRTLADEIRTSGPLPAPRVRDIGAAVADALAEAHRLGIVHRDVKPANILLTERGVPKLADFGIARSSAVSTTGALLGTPAFVAPEVVRGAIADARSDVWSLGATLYAALEGRSPFQRGDDDSVYAVLNRVINDPVAPPNDPVLGPAVMRLLNPDPAARPSAAHLAHELLSLPPVGTGPGDNNSRIRTRTSGARRAALVGVIAVVAIVGVVAALLVSGSDNSRAGESAAPVSPVSPVSPGTSTRASPATTAPAASYSAPGGITVRGPVGWVADTSAGIANVRDFRAPGTTDRATGAYFRIGIANAKPADTIEKEASGTERYLLAENNAKIVSSRTTTFLGGPAVDQEYTRTNSSGVARHLLLRLWFHAGQTLELELDTPQDEFAQRRAIFDQLIATCELG